MSDLTRTGEAPHGARWFICPFRCFGRLSRTLSGRRRGQQPAYAQAALVCLDDPGLAALTRGDAAFRDEALDEILRMQSDGLGRSIGAVELAEKLMEYWDKHPLK